MKGNCEFEGNVEGLENLFDVITVKDLGCLTYFLGLEVARNERSITLNRRKYALEILQDIDLIGSKPVRTPMKQNLHLSNMKET